jgi:prepilin-type processing-associated H-X9-DG protein
MPPQNYRPPQRQTTYRPGPPPKQGSPIGPIIAVLIGLAVVVAAAVVVVPMFKNVKSVASQTDCFTNLNELHKGLMMYAQDYNERIPIASNWTNGLGPYTRTTMICPGVENPKGIDTKLIKTGYALNSNVAGVHFPEISQPSSTLLFYDSSVLGRNVSDPGTSLPVPGRHGGFNSVCFVDGHTAKK